MGQPEVGEFTNEYLPFGMQANLILILMQLHLNGVDLIWMYYTKYYTVLNLPIVNKSTIQT